MKKLFLSLLAVSLSFVAVSRNVEESITKDAEASSITRVNNSALTVKVPKYIFSGLNTNIDLVFTDANNAKLLANNNDLFFIINGEDTKIHFDKNGVGTFHHSFTQNENLSIYFEDFNYSSNVHVIPIWYVVVPVALLVVFLSFKLIRSGRRNKSVANSNAGEVLGNDNQKDVTIAEVKNNNETQSKTVQAETTTDSEKKVATKEVVDKEEEIFA